jgi:hemolysin activation/secretion protein
MSGSTFKRRLISLGTAFLWAGISPSLSWAQFNSGINSGALQQELEKQLPLPSPLPLPESSKPKPLTPVMPKKGEVQFDLEGIAIEGVQTLTGDEIRDAVKPWLGKPVSLSGLRELCDAIADAYRVKGFNVLVTTPPQEIKNGVVKVLVRESKLGKVSVITPAGETRLSKEDAVGYVTYENPIGGLLNTKNLERSLIILNETPGVVANAQLQKGQGPSETDVQLQLGDTKFITGKAEVNNYGSRYTGQTQGLVSVLMNNPSGKGDQAYINGLYSQGSNYVQGGYTYPISYNGTRIGINGSSLNYNNIGIYGPPNGSYGNAWTASINAAYPVIRSQGGNLNASINYDIKSYTNNLQAINETSSAYNIKNVVANLSGNFYDSFLGGAVTAGSLSFIAGNLEILPTSISNYGMYTPGSFNKGTFSANRVQQLTFGGDTSIYIALSGQMASVNLNSAEQFYLGGPFGVRAYPVAQGNGSQGGLGTIELRHMIQPGLQGYAFFDSGFVQQFKNPYMGWQGLTNANNTYSLSGAGVGVRWNYESVSIGAMVAWQVGKNPLYNQYGQAVNNDGTTTNPLGWITGSFYF